LITAVDAQGRSVRGAVPPGRGAPWPLVQGV